MEIWDSYDVKFNLNEGKILKRGEPIPDGEYHLVCDIVVKHIDGTYLVMQRAPEKHYPGMWEASAGGSALRGETSVECAIRELHEETGILVNDLTELGFEVDQKTKSIFVEYYVEVDIDKNDIVLQKGETVAFKWVSADELRNMKQTELLTDRMQKYINELQRRKE